MTDRSETATWIAMTIILGGLYAYGVLGPTADAFGINALRALSPSLAMALLVAGSAAAFVAGGSGIGRRFGSARPGRVAAGLMAVAAGSLMFLGRSNFVNPDGRSFATKFLADVPRYGAHVTHDEMLELYVHSRFWFYTHEWWGWSVESSYQVVSCLAGAAFVYAMLRLAPRLAPRAPWLLVGGALAGGYLQLFFGDVENYTVTAALVAFYLLAAARFVADEVPLWVPTVALAAAILFHLVAGWLLPSLWYLATVSRTRHGDRREWAPSIALGSGLAAAVLVYLHFHGLPIQRIVSSHAARAVRVTEYSYFIVPDRATAGYYREQLNLLVLLCPAIVMAAPLVAWRRLAPDTAGRFLLVAASSLLLFQLVWRAQLGVYNDWNLFAVGGLVVGVALWRAVALAATTPLKRAAACALAVTAALHTGAWIVGNHAYGP